MFNFCRGAKASPRLPCAGVGEGTHTRTDTHAHAHGISNAVGLGKVAGGEEDASMLHREDDARADDGSLMSFLDKSYQNFQLQFSPGRSPILPQEHTLGRKADLRQTAPGPRESAPITQEPSSNLLQTPKLPQTAPVPRDAAPITQETASPAARSEIAIESQVCVCVSCVCVSCVCVCLVCVCSKCRPLCVVSVGPCV